MKFFLIIFGVLVIVIIAAFAYIRELNVEINKCEEVAGAQLSNLAYRYSPSVKLCKSGQRSIEQLMQCEYEVRENHKENKYQLEIYDQIQLIVEPAVEDSGDFIKIHNNICDIYPDTMANY